MVNMFLKSFHKCTQVIPVTDRMVDLNGKRQETLAVPFEELAHGENRQQELAVVKHIDVEGR